MLAFGPRLSDYVLRCCVRFSEASTNRIGSVIWWNSVRYSAELRFFRGAEAQDRKMIGWDILPDRLGHYTAVQANFVLSRRQSTQTGTIGTSFPNKLWSKIAIRFSVLLENRIHTLDRECDTVI